VPVSPAACLATFDRCQFDLAACAYDHFERAPGNGLELQVMGILMSIAKWLSFAAGAIVLFGVLLVGLLAWLLNRPVD
jgi:hypothetical protein